MLWGGVGNPSQGEILQADRKVDGIPQAGERVCVKAWGFRAWHVSSEQQGVSIMGAWEGVRRGRGRTSREQTWQVSEATFCRALRSTAEE